MIFGHHTHTHTSETKTKTTQTAAFFGVCSAQFLRNNEGIQAAKSHLKKYSFFLVRKDCRMPLNCSNPRISWELIMFGLIAMVSPMLGSFFMDLSTFGQLSLHFFKSSCSALKALTVIWTSVRSCNLTSLQEKLLRTWVNHVSLLFND